MKKFLTMAMSLAVALLAFSSCQKESLTGKVTYTLNTYTSGLNNDDITAWQAVEKNYTDALSAIQGVVTEPGKKFVLEGKYDACDKLVMDACAAAEAKSASYTFKSGFKLEVVANYPTGDVRTATISSHQFGK